MGAARKLTKLNVLHDRTLPRTSSKQPKKGRTRTLRKVSTKTEVAFGMSVRWSEASMKDLQRKCYHLRNFHNWTQEELASRAGLCVGTVIRFEDVERQMLAPRLKTFLLIFRQGFGAKIDLSLE
jgi:DNA-binding XRE family transcriptional regulator